MTVSQDELRRSLAALGDSAQNGAAHVVELDPNDYWSLDFVMYLCTGVLVVCLASMILATWALRRQGASASQLLKLFAVLSIINISAIVIIAGYGPQQVAPILGLFGAIAGYLLGKDVQTAQNQGSKDAKEPS
jgi:hypothetical protein